MFDFLFQVAMHVVRVSFALRDLYLCLHWAMGFCLVLIFCLWRETTTTTTTTLRPFNGLFFQDRLGKPAPER